MMDISHIMRGPIVEGEGHKDDSDFKHNDSSEETFDDEKCKQGERYRNLKRSLEEDLINSKKRRKQLKPIRIATNLEDMVQVPKQIIGLNNDLDNINDMSHTVPKESSSKSQCSPNNITLNNVHFPNNNRLPVETSSDQKSHDSNGSVDNYNRDVDKSEVTELNVPNLETGPNYLTNPNFMFPFSFQPMKNAHNYWSDRNLKIFNHEAYCELCKKEFCNKYFLKTHKANKHGIYVDFPSTSVTKQQKSEIRDNVSVANKISENGKNMNESDCERAFCDLCNKRFCNKYFVRRHKTKSHGFVDDDSQYGVASFLCQDTDLNIVQNSSNHSTKETGSTLTSFEPLSLIKNENDSDFDNQEINNKKTSEEQISPLNLIVNVTSKDEEEADEDEDKTKETDDRIAEDETDECSSENIEKLQTMLLRLNPSEIENKICKVCNELKDSSLEHKCGLNKKEIKFDKEYLSETNDSSNDSKNDYQSLKNDNHEYSYLTRLDHLKNMKPTSSYCEICNKELCNKYFMRTHMQRMHGIEIEHGTQIGGVVCNICNKELCSKYFLRVHKQNTHGIMSPNSLVGASASATLPSPRVEVKTNRSELRFTSGLSQVCYICNKRFRSPKWLQAHLLSDHREESANIPVKEESVEEEEKAEEESSSTLKIPRKNSGLTTEPATEPPETLDVISKLFWENNSLSKSYNCSQCPFSTSVLAFLFVHERSHFVLAQEQSSESVKPSVSLQNLIHDKTFWQHKITQQLPECLDLSAGKAKYLSFEQNGS